MLHDACNNINGIPKQQIVADQQILDIFNKAHFLEKVRLVISGI